MKILVTGGGTGGHIYPALALIKRIEELEPATEFLYVGTYRGMESSIVPDHGVNFQAIKVEGFKRSLSLKGIVYNIKTVKYFLSSIKKAKNIIKAFKPDLVIGTGGYVSAPVCYAASKENIPTVIHEQNSVVGITNKFLARYASAIAICFEEAREQFKGHEDKVTLTGNPRAQEVAGLEKTAILKEYGLNPDKPTVLIFGGSRGSVKINEVVLSGCRELTQKRYQVLFVTGKDHFDSVNAQWIDKCTQGGIREDTNVKVVPYISDLPQLFASVSLVVSRSGATTLSELTSLGVPSVLIPSPNVTEDHQTKNAQSLENNGAAVLIAETDLSAEILINTIDQLVEDERQREEMGRASLEMGKQNASDLIIKVMLDLLKK